MKREFICFGILLTNALLFGGSLLGQSRDAAFSSNGSMIVYVSKVGDHNQVFMMKADGSDQKQITNTAYSNYYPFFSPDDSKIVFMSLPNGNDSIICLINADGSNNKCLTKAEEGTGDPHWSPDGLKIIFFSSKDGSNEIYLMNIDGGDLTRLTNNPASDQTPSISPDGKSIVFVSDRDGNPELYVMGIDGDNVRRLTLDPRADRVPSWSSDGKKIIWYSREPSEVAGSGKKSWSGAEIYEINVDGSNRKQLTHNLDRDQGPVYSPDGNRIVFTSQRSGTNEVFSMNADGTDVKQITFSESKESNEP